MHIPHPWTLEQLDQSKLEGLEGEHLDIAIGEQCACVDCGFRSGVASDPITREQLCPFCLYERRLKDPVPRGLHHRWYANPGGTTTVEYYWGLARLSCGTARTYREAEERAMAGSLDRFDRIILSQLRANKALRLDKPGLARTTPTKHNERKASHG